MSEEIELPDILCTTEDAFESFQANVSYEEEEFITLSDLVSPPDNIDIELPEDTLEAIGNGENAPCRLNTQSTIEVTEENTNGNIDETLVQNNKSREHSTLIDSIQTDSKITESLNTSLLEKYSTRRRRGSKNVLTTQNETVFQKSNLKAKRGRPKKNQHLANENPLPITNDNKDSNSDNSPSISSINNSTKVRGRRSKKEPITKSSINSNIIDNNDSVHMVSSTINDSLLTQRNRRRPKKYSDEPEKLINISQDVIGADESVLTTSQRRSKRVPKGKGKRGVKSKVADLDAIINSTAHTANSEHDNIVNGSENNIMTDIKLQNNAIDSSSILVENDQDNSFDEEADDICLSILKSRLDVPLDYDEKTETFEDLEVQNKEQKKLNFKEQELDLKDKKTETIKYLERLDNEQDQINLTDTISKISPEKPVLEDFEYNIDTIVSKTEIDMKQNEMENKDTECEIKDSSKRSVRRRTKQTFKYDEESDEDPFANVELSDDEPRRRKKCRYHSDDEYIPGRKESSPESSLDSDSESIKFDEDKKQRKRKFKKLDNSDKIKSPKKGKNNTNTSLGNNSTTEIETDLGNNITTESDIIDMDIEDSLKSSVLIKDTSNSWEASDMTDLTFLAKKIQGTDIKIIKTKPSQGPATKFEIPVLDPNEPKKCTENSTQTKTIAHISVVTQTDSQQDLAMKKQVNLSSEQAENACEFLKSIVETTAELGELMTQKSRDFIKKKINTTNVTDTLKMDYCVKKSFLLFKLAKHNLMQMEQDLETKYEEFLETNNLLQYRENRKVIISQEVAKDDSDCEIVEEITPAKPKANPKLNPKTVFLNKELSIKIAKNTKSPAKSTEKKNIRGRHTVWINDSVMVKKIQPTQSFLAQDSRNKKPPDYVTLEMVKTFFDNYYRKLKILSICRPYTSMKWLSVNHDYVCNYFVKDATDFESGIHEDLFTQSETDADTAASAFAIKIKATTSNSIISPKSLLTICTESIQKYLHVIKQYNESIIVDNVGKNSSFLQQDDTNCFTNLTTTVSNTHEGEIKSLKTICTLKINRLLCRQELNIPEKDISHNRNMACETKNKELSLHHMEVIQIIPLIQLCFKIIQKYFVPLTEESTSYSVNSLSSIAVQVINRGMMETIASINSINPIQDSTLSSDAQESMALTINCVSTVTEEDFSNFQPPEFNTSPYIDYNNDEDDRSFVEEDYNSDADYAHQPDMEDTNWVSKVQMQELRSCILPSTDSPSFDISEKVNKIVSSEQPSIARIKIEPEESEPAIDIIKVKTELPDEEEVHVSSVNVLTKQEHIEEILGIFAEPRPQLSKQGSKTFDEDMFETFVRSNKITKDINTSYLLNDDEIFSQSSQRVRRQYEPDSDDEVNTFDNMGLLVPQNVEIAKDQLMENSSDEGSNQKPGKKRGAKSSKSKKNVKESVSKDKLSIMGNDVAVLTRSSKDKPPIFASDVAVLTRSSKDKPPIVASDVAVLTRSCKDKPPIVASDVAVVTRSSKDKPPIVASNVALSTRSCKDKPPIVASDVAVVTRSSKDKPPIVASNVALSTRSCKDKPPIVANDIALQTRSSKDKLPIVGNDVAILTRRMKERIRQEEKKNESSDSDMDDIPLLARRVKHQVHEKAKASEEKKEERKTKAGEAQEKNIKTPEKEIQCSEVDSTELITPDTHPQENGIRTRRSNLNKLKISPCEQVAQNESEEKPYPDFDPNIPPELLECEPEISVENGPIKKITNKKKPTNSTVDCVSSESNPDKSKETEYIERHGWKCYTINTNDAKIYENASVVLDKLPESFVETYFRFQEIGDGSDDDAEVNRLTNLASLTRSLPKDKNRTRPKDKNIISKNPKLEVDSNPNEENNIEDDHLAELEPSEDEDDGPDQMHVSQIAPQNAENCMAKNFLMDDNESDPEHTNKLDGSIKIKQEPGTENEPEIKTKADPKSKTKIGVKSLNSGESVMLTADIMMNSELALLNAPVILKQEMSPEVKDVPKLVTKSSTRHSNRKQKLTNKMNVEQDESSSEEEKQWVYTKEKLLKRIEKKHETAIVDEAKGAKRVSEFIEKRGEASEQQKQRPSKRGKEKSKKKMLERRKQMKVLAKELFGEQLSSGKCSQNYRKGRRNIRKVLNKTSLNHATIVANKEEFERKRRLNNKQIQLKEHLGCEEGVNVVVINDELCLEYDFERNVPVVGVHKFFTKVMKAHQYEGVKFMWDACFESVSLVASGHLGGGCILAHCMGLGKTLQVLALLHTALTQPMLKIRRVLVCCPLSTVLNWVDEIHKWIDPVTDKIKTFELSKLKRTYERAYQLEDWYNNGGIFIIGYELFRSLTTLDSDIDNVRPTYIKKIRTALLDPGPDIIVCDEGHLLKNDCSVLAVAMSRVSTKRRIVLTGTPMQNNLREYYCMVNFVKPSLLGTYSEYSNRFENPIMNGQHRDSRQDDIILMKTRTHILHKVLEGCLQRLEASVLYPYLPKKYEYTVFIPLTKWQKDMYKHYLHCYASKGKQSVLKDFHILQKIWTHPQVLHNFQTRTREAENRKIKAEKLEDDLAQEDIAASEDVKPAQTEVWWLQYLEGGEMLHALECSNKFNVVFQLLDECVALGDKVLIFSTSLYTMDALEHFLKHINRWSLGQEYYRLDGSVPADVRQKWCREFNAEHNERTKLFLISTRAGCLGLNMTAANRVIILDTSWNPAHDIQSIFRVYRFGQKKDCYIYRLVAMGTMEQKIYERSVTKQAVACRVVDEQQIDRHFNSADLTELYNWNEEGWGVLAGMAPTVRDPALLRVAAGGALHAVREHDSLLRGSEPALPEHERAAAWQEFQLEHAHPNTHAAPPIIKRRDSAPEVKPSTSNDYTSSPYSSGKAKEERNIETIKDEIPRPPEEPPPDDDAISSDKEELLVKKIMQILIDNNFHEKIQAEDLTTLIVNVRRLVSSRMMDSGLLNDPIAAKIADVLLQDDDMNNGVTVPDNIQDSPAISDHEHNYDTREANYDDNYEEPIRRRKRLLKPLEEEETESSDDIDDGDGDASYDANDVDWTVNDRAMEPTNKLKMKTRQKRKTKLKKIHRVKSIDKIDQDTREPKVECVPSNAADSILISDDDDVIEKEAPEAPPVVPSKKLVLEVPKKKETHQEKVPLHPLILSNENFIKIVAHMYLRGNSMLSDDAAKMAAQYSTSKARSEFEATGVPITSGPLYEIAVESLGIEQLKKMHQSIQPEIATSAPKAPQPTTSKDTSEDDDDVQVVHTIVERKIKVFAGPKSRKKQLEQSAAASPKPLLPLPPPQLPRPQLPQPQLPRPQLPKPQLPRPQLPRPQPPRPQLPRPQPPPPQLPRPQPPMQQRPRPELARPRLPLARLPSSHRPPPQQPPPQRLPSQQPPPQRPPTQQPPPQRLPSQQPPPQRPPPQQPPPQQPPPPQRPPSQQSPPQLPSPHLPLPQLPQETPPEPQPQSVFPVGMFIGPGDVAQPLQPVQDMEECILPDDDDDDIVMSSIIQTPQAGLNDSPQHLTRQHLTPQHLKPQHLTPQHLTPQHLTQQHLTSQQLTSQYLTQQTLTTQPLTAHPFTTQPLSNNETQTQHYQPKIDKPAIKLRRLHPTEVIKIRESQQQHVPVSLQPPTSTYMPLISIDRGVPSVPVIEKRNESQAANEPICLSDSDDERVEPPHPITIINPNAISTVPQHTLTTADATPKVTPIVLKSSSFKGNTPFILSPNGKQMLDPNKKYYCIPSSSFNANTTNAIVPDATMIPIQNMSQISSQPAGSIMITSLGKIQVDGTSSQSQSNNGKNTPHIIISPATLSQSCNVQTLPSNSQQDCYRIPEQNELFTDETYSSNENKTLPTQGATNTNRRSAQSLLNTSIPSTSTANSYLSQGSSRETSPSPPIDHISLFKDVVQIQAETYKDVPTPQSKKIITTPKTTSTSSNSAILAKQDALKSKQNTMKSKQNTMKSKQNAMKSKQESLLLKKDLPKPRATIDLTHLSGDRPVMIAKTVSASSSNKQSPSSIPIYVTGSCPEERRKKKLLVLKKIEKVKFDGCISKADNSKASSSRGSKVSGAARPAGKKLTPASGSFIDLTDIPEPRPKVEKRPAPFVEKPVKKQKKLLTLADFDLDDTDDILELG